MTEQNSIPRTVTRSIAIVFLRVALVALLVGAGVVIYKQWPAAESETAPEQAGTNVQIILRNVPGASASDLDVRVDIYPVDIVAVHHEFLAAPRPGNRSSD